MQNRDGNVNDKATDSESVEDFAEILQIAWEFESRILFDEVALKEWVRVEIVAISVYRRRKARLPEVDFTHLEIEEVVSPGIVETAEEILADSLFELWLLEKGVRNARNEDRRYIPS